MWVTIWECANCANREGDDTGLGAPFHDAPGSRVCMRCFHEEPLTSRESVHCDDVTSDD